MSITATVEKDTIKLPDGIHVPDFLTGKAGHGRELAWRG
jgi:hypothetical protein